MNESLVISPEMAASNNLAITEVVDRYRSRLLDFIRPRVASAEDAEDIVQEVFYEFSEAVRMMQPIEQVASWLYTVARNRITDLYRKKKATPFSFLASEDSEDGFPEEIAVLLLENEASPESEYLKSLVWQQLREALDELPIEQREVFEKHELQGISFKEISKQTGQSVNTLLSRKRYAVLHLRERLREIYDEFISF